MSTWRIFRTSVSYAERGRASSRGKGIALPWLPEVPIDRALSFLLVLSACGAGRKASPEVAAVPGALALDASGVAELTATMDARVESGACPGYAFVVARPGGARAAGAGGYADLERARPMTPATPVLVASMSKPVTAVAVLQLVERGRLGLDQPVSDLVPEFAAARVAVSPNRDADGAFVTVPLDRPVTIHDLLTHTAGLGYDFGTPSDLLTANIEADLMVRPYTLETMSRAVAAVPLYSQPGERWRYSWASDVLGRVVEVAAGQPFAEYLDDHVFTPLGMPDTGFPLGEMPEDLARLYVHEAPGSLAPAAQNVSPDTWPSGGGGLVSTADDFSRFALMLLQEGELDGVRILSAASVGRMRSDQLTDAQRPTPGDGGFFFDSGFGYGVGVAIEAFPEANAGRGVVPGDYGWAGAYDTTFLVSPARDLVGVVMTQVVPGPHLPSRNEEAFVRHLGGVVAGDGAEPRARAGSTGG